MTNSLLTYGEIYCAFPHILESPSSYMTLQLLHSEFPYIWRKFDFLFYQWTDWEWRKVEDWRWNWRKIWGRIEGKWRKILQRMKNSNGEQSEEHGEQREWRKGNWRNKWNFARFITAQAKEVCSLQHHIQYLVSCQQGPHEPISLASTLL